MDDTDRAGRLLVKLEATRADLILSHIGSAKTFLDIVDRATDVERRERGLASAQKAYDQAVHLLEHMTYMNGEWRANVHAAMAEVLARLVSRADR